MQLELHWMKVPLVPLVIYGHLWSLDFHREIASTTLPHSVKTRHHSARWCHWRRGVATLQIRFDPVQQVGFGSVTSSPSCGFLVV
jgi:hypothetical protein